MNDYMTINLSKGNFKAIEGHNVLTSRFNDLILPCTRYEFNLQRYNERLPSIEDTYKLLSDGNYSPEDALDVLIQLYFPLRYFRVGDYERMALVIGLIGMRGGGKSCGAVSIGSCDWLLRGLPLWSNLDVKIKVVYKDLSRIFESRDMEELDFLDITGDYRGGCLLVDEANMEVAESTRYASSANLRFSYALQQIRKRLMSVVWTTQGWSWVDNRLRWQTDFLVACRDASMEKKHYDNSGVGDKSLWRVHDLSGTGGSFDYDYELKHRYLSDYLVWQGVFWNRPWWKAYQTERLQGQDDYVRTFKASVEKRERDEKLSIPAPEGQFRESIPRFTNTLEQNVEDLLALNRDSLSCSDVWQFLKIDGNKSLQTIVGSLFAANGYKRSGSSRSGYYWKKVREVN